MNFQINNNEIVNHCDNGKGKCCMMCQYLTDANNKEWLACSDSCIINDEVNKFSCTQCKHKPNYIL